jgi:putative transposase
LSSWPTGTAGFQPTKQRRRVARLHEKIANVRQDFQHQTAYKLVQAFDVICHESLAIRNMVRNHSLAWSISDAEWGQFIAILIGKAAGAGRLIVAVHLVDKASYQARRPWYAGSCQG